MDRDRSVKKNEENVKADEPSWRFAQINPPLAASVAGEAESSDIIDKASFFAKAEGKTSGLIEEEVTDEDANPWSPKEVRTVPAFYPLEKSSRFIEDDHLAVASRLSECLRALSVHATYNDEIATASLVTGENVEMHLSLWKTSGAPTSRYPVGIVVELQRRKGDSIVFHRYNRYILDAAMGEFDSCEFQSSTGGDVANMYTKKAERMLKMKTGKTAATEEENAIIAVEIAHGLLMKDRMDARQLGLESLCLLTDPTKTGNTTALIASHVVLLGTAQDVTISSGEGVIFDESPFQEIRETILSLVQFNKIGEDAELSDDERGSMEEDEFESQQIQEREHLSILHNLALAVMANALQVVEKNESTDNEPERTETNSKARLDCKEIATTFMSEGKEITNKEILSTLISELGKAAKTPHNATLSAKCLSSLMGASEDARKRAKELGAKNVVATALDVGVRTHAKLETECKKVFKVLTRVRTQEEEQQDAQQDAQQDEQQDEQQDNEEENN
mmetsp:Transcript_41148/g.46760  ORF Transcript_41148/g.46760 Transcript_41148/m.46760 type:complete len:507 (-) Transcript_41148:444-1964(-)|eukprot:CAMPEP_0194146354 /NCGR_PEP_ID=MMETSP0152-20130528/20536_1 /TAXON_ID=1049557 /ORGANISM="Thalassiothrix antarctica, Strain L6-D1" /LENGTH=506 /DNA_ID=CAMNT_0038846849 /DNA_START=115 /DNA_END=1635 /DNA_ORIENTATION=-